MGGGGSNSAQREADQQEAKRQAQIAASTAKINAIFSDPSRQSQYDALQKNTTAYYQADLDRQNTVAQRKLKFSLARSGNAGGSVQRDQGKVLGEDYLHGVTLASQQGQKAAANLQGQDEATKQSLIAMAQAGLDTTTAGSEAASSLRANLQSSQADATANGLGEAFGNLNNIYQQSQDAKNAREGMKYGYGSIFGNPLYGQSSAATQPYNYQSPGG